MLGIFGAVATVSLTAGGALAYNGALSPEGLQAAPGGSSQGSTGSLGSGGPSTAPTTPPTTTDPPPSTELPEPATNGLSVVPRVAGVAAVEQNCHIAVYYGPLPVEEGRGYVITVGPERSVLGATEVGAAGDGTASYRLIDPVDYRERAVDRTYYAMEVEVLDDGRQLPLGDPAYHHLGHVPNPEDGACSTDGREISITDSAN